MKYRIENIQPVLNVRDIAVSVEFYTNVLGFEAAPWGNLEFTSVNRDGSSIYLCRGAQGAGGTWIWIGFDGDITSLFAEFKSRGATFLLEPTNFSWAYEMRLFDADGHTLRFGTDPDPSLPFADRQAE